MSVCEKVIKEIESIFNRSGITANIEIMELNIVLGLNGSEDLDVLINIDLKVGNMENA